MNLKLMVRSKVSETFINDFKKAYQPRTNIVKDKKGNLVTDSHSILARWNHFSHLLNVLGVTNVRQTEIHAAEPLVSESSACDVEMAVKRLKRHKSLGMDQIPAELVKSGGRTICPETHKLTNSIWNKKELKESIIVPIYKKCDKTDCSNYRGISFCELHTRLRVFGNRVFRRIFGPKRDDITGEWKRLYNEELNGLYS